MSQKHLTKLYKQLISECGKFTDYNFRNHALRRVQYNYEKHLTETDPSKLEQLTLKAEEEVGVIQRQVTIGQLYAAEKHILDKD